MAGSLPRAERPVAMGTGAKVECVRARSGDGRGGGDRGPCALPRDAVSWAGAGPPRALPGAGRGLSGEAGKFVRS